MCLRKCKFWARDLNDDALGRYRYERFYFLFFSPNEANVQEEERESASRTSSSPTLRNATLKPTHGKSLPWTAPDGEVFVARISAFRNSTPITGRGKEGTAERPCAARTNNPGPPVSSDNACPNCHRVCRSRIGLNSHFRTHRPLHG